MLPDGLECGYAPVYGLQSVRRGARRGRGFPYGPDSPGLSGEMFSLGR